MIDEQWCSHREAVGAPGGLVTCRGCGAMVNPRDVPKVSARELEAEIDRARAGALEGLEAEDGARAGRILEAAGKLRAGPMTRLTREAAEILEGLV